MAVAIDQHHGFKSFNRSQRCRLQSFTHFDYNIHELSQTNLTNSLTQAFEVSNIHRSFSTPCFSLETRFEEEFDVIPRVEIVSGHGAPRVDALVVEVAIAMASGVDPMPVSSGLGGAYFLQSRNGNNIAVAKPIDEEPLAFNKPKSFCGLMLGQPGMKRTIRVGGTEIRELAAYLLDHGGFAGVPPTTIVKIAHVGFHVDADAAHICPPPYKIASLQRFVDHDFDAGELGPSGFSIASVHRIGIFDVRLLNLDRHAGNILVKKNDQHENYADGAAELVPIDHGLCLPESLDDPYFEWLHWPQASVPFSESEFEYISNLDPFKDADFLRSELPSLRESSIRVLVLCTIFLKRAAAAGFCLADIGEMMTREPCGGEENLSVLENLCAKAKASVLNISKNDVEDGDKIKKNNEQRIDENKEVAIFQFDDESRNASNNVLDLLQISQCPSDTDHQYKIPTLLSTRSTPRLQDGALSSPQNEENDHDNGHAQDDEYNDEKKVIKGKGCNNDDNGDGSISYSVQNYNCETGSICLGEMSRVEWELFLDCFEELLDEVLKAESAWPQCRELLCSSVEESFQEEKIAELLQI